MKYAMVDGQRREALPGLGGTCPICDAVMMPKCGRFRVPHWAHPPGKFDHRWEPETEWHRVWKGRFPEACQEKAHHASNGERHIADVKTEHGRVLEFQHSAITEDERRSREGFYGKMYWVVDGQKGKRDRQRFFKSLRSGRPARVNPLTLVVPIEESVLLQKWADSRVLVLFDFGETEEGGDMFRFGAPVLWASYPRRMKGVAVLRPLYRKAFVEAVTRDAPLGGIDFSKAFERALRLSLPGPIPSRAQPWKSRSPNTARKRWMRARRRF